MWLIKLVFLCLVLSQGYAVDKNNFKTCDQSGFCKRLRGFKPDKSLYRLNLESIKVTDNVLTAEVFTVYPGSDNKDVEVPMYFFKYYLYKN